MNSSLQFGPLAVPLTLLLILGASAAGIFIGKRVGRVAGIDVEPQALRLLLAALVLARLAFVWQYRDAYFDAPLDILDIRDGGWDSQVGVMAAVAGALIFVRGRPLLRKPLLATVGTACAIWIGGTIALLLMPQNDARLPATALPTFDGDTASLTAFEGKPTVVNLWASWCPPCRREMPVLQRAQARHPELHFVFLNQGESPDQVRRFIATGQLALRNVLLDPKGQTGAQFSRSALPTTLFFDAQGRLVDQRIGELSEATLAQRLSALQTSPTSKP